MIAQQLAMIKFKCTSGALEPIELAFQTNKTVEDYINDLAELFDVETQNIKCVFKGKVLNWKTTAENAKLKNGTVMVVINTTKKQVKKVMTSKQQTVPGAGMSTGLGSSSPFGIGGYEMVNHPQYMSAISSAVDPDKVEQLMQDPQYQGMMQQLLDDPDTLRQLINENPMLKNQMNSNPMMKMVLQNPALLKMVMNKETIKKTKQFMKNGGKIQDLEKMQTNLYNQPQMQMNNYNNMNFNNPMTMNGFPGMGGFGGMGGFNQNPFMLNPAVIAQNQKIIDQATYKQQLKQLQLMGFKDKQKNITILKQVGGDIDLTLQKLCSQ